MIKHYNEKVLNPRALEQQKMLLQTYQNKEESKNEEIEKLENLVKSLYATNLKLMK